MSNCSGQFVNMSRVGNKRVLYAQAREIVCNFYDYMRVLFPSESVTKLKEHVSKCTNVSVRSVERILKERQDSIANNGTAVLKSPPKRHRKCTVTSLEEFEIIDFRNVIYNFHLTEGCQVTISHLNEKLKNDFGFQGNIPK